jgi:hypothetical protein
VKRRYVHYVANANGWSDWHLPIHGKGERNYRNGCCDCGLVHEYQYRVKIVDGKPAVLFRCRRNNKATAAMRRAKRFRSKK